MYSKNKTATRWVRIGLTVAMAVSALLAGCMTAPLDMRREADYHAKAPTADRPVVRPTRALTSFTDSLMCMDRLLRASNLPTTLIASKQIPDPSGKVPAAIKDMIITALSQMSRLSNAFRYVDYEVDIARQDTVQNLTTILLNNNQLQLQRPALYVSGAIAYFDQQVISNRFDAGTSAARLDSGYSQSRNASVLALELHLGDFRTRTLIPGIDSANEVVIGGGGQGLDVAGRIGSYSVHFNVGRDYSLGVGGALRTLIDLGVIEMVGKWARVPYWQCLTLENTDPHFQRQMRDWFEEGSPLAQNRLVQQSLITQGYLASGGVDLGPNDPELIEALGRFQADSGIVVSGVVDFATYERALRDFVTLGTDGRLLRVGWTSAAPMSRAVPMDRTVSATGRARSSVGGPGGARVLDLQLENPMVGRTAFEVGEQVFVSAALSRASYLYCFYQDGAGRVLRLLPNPANPSALVSGNLTLRIPDWMSPMPGFIMDATSPGTERLGCYAVGRDLAIPLPQLLSPPAFVGIPDIANLEAVTTAIAGASGREGYTAASLEWQVVPRRPPANAPTNPPATAPNNAPVRK
jgi:hypothetical protein